MAVNIGEAICVALLPDLLETSVSMSGGKWKVHGEDEDEGTFWIIRLPDTDMMIIKMHLV